MKNSEQQINPLLDLFKLAKPCEEMTVTDKAQLMDVYKRSMRPTYTNASAPMTSEGCTIILEGRDERFSDFAAFIPKSIIDQVDFEKFCYAIIDQIAKNSEHAQTTLISKQLTNKQTKIMENQTRKIHGLEISQKQYDLYIALRREGTSRDVALKTVSSETICKKVAK